MKKISLILFYFIIAQGTFAQVIEKIIDSRDGKVYRTIKLGSQVWMGENLNYAADSSSWCYDNLPENCMKYGRLYTWEMANKVCPDGWHLPSDEEWKTLEKFFGMAVNELDSSNYRGRMSNIGGKLKSKSNWESPNLGAIDDDGFNALPGGCYGTSEKAFFHKGKVGMFYTSTSYGSDFAYYRDLDCSDSTVFRGHRNKRIAYSVRCIKNE